MSAQMTTGELVAAKIRAESVADHLRVVVAGRRSRRAWDDLAFAVESFLAAYDPNRQDARPR